MYYRVTTKIKTFIYVQPSKALFLKRCRERNCVTVYGHWKKLATIRIFVSVAVGTGDVL